MVKPKRCSINWDNAILGIVIITALVITIAGILSLALSSDGRVAVDWGNHPRVPCLPTDPKCKSGPVAVDWGDHKPTDLPADPVDGYVQVAVDWGDRMVK